LLLYDKYDILFYSLEYSCCWHR